MGSDVHDVFDILDCFVVCVVGEGIRDLNKGHLVGVWFDGRQFLELLGCGKLAA